MRAIEIIIALRDSPNASAQHRILRAWECEIHNLALDYALAAVRAAQCPGRSPDTKNAVDDIEFFRMKAGSMKSFKCGARGPNGANDPQECDWPVCGCDPDAEKVLDALVERGQFTR